MLACTTPPTLSLLELDGPYGGADTSSQSLEEESHASVCLQESERERGGGSVTGEGCERKMMLIKTDNRVTEGAK